MHDELCDAEIFPHPKRKAVLHNLKYYLNLFFKVVTFFCALFMSPIKICLQPNSSSKIIKFKDSWIHNFNRTETSCTIALYHIMLKLRGYRKKKKKIKIQNRDFKSNIFLKALLNLWNVGKHFYRKRITTKKIRCDKSDGFQPKIVKILFSLAHTHTIRAYEKCLFLSSRLLWLTIVNRYRRKSLC